MKKIKIMPEYGCSPLWFYDGLNPVENMAVTELAISNSLKNDIEIWANSYESTFNEDYPPNSGFPTISDEETFELAGIRIWEKLQKEIGKFYSISYYSTLVGKTYDNSDEYRKICPIHSPFVLQTDYVSATDKNLTNFRTSFDYGILAT